MASQTGKVIFMLTPDQIKSAQAQGYETQVVDSLAGPEPVEEPVEEPKPDYSWKLREKIKAPDNPVENVIRYRAQSLMGVLLPYEQAKDVIDWAERNGLWK